MTREPFIDFYRIALGELGLTVDPSDGIPGQLPSRLPDALVAWYRLAGNSPISSMHNRLLTPDRLGNRGTKVVFAEENQAVVIWAYDEADEAPDPEVWQGQPLPDGSEESIEWYSEELPLSQFIIEMLRHTSAVDLPSPTSTGLRPGHDE